jgi:retron-type reverse transcriptase
MPKIQFQHNYYDIISLENLLKAWKEFVKGKRSRQDVQEFERNLMPNIIGLHNDLAEKTYVHSTYQTFKIADPKPRIIHKASVRDRLLHHALHRELAPFFVKVFIADSNSCQEHKGTHRALGRFRRSIDIVSLNHMKTVWVFKGDIKKFFANIDQEILLTIMAQYISDLDIIWLLSIIVKSFHVGIPGVGFPLGNLTSQLFSNIYMNEFDQFIKNELKAKYYVRYADDFVILSSSQVYLENILPAMHEFLDYKLKLRMHPDKIFIKTIASGVDFLGWVHFMDHRVLRATTKNRMIRKLAMNSSESVVNSYLGLLGHGNTWGIKAKYFIG